LALLEHFLQIWPAIQLWQKFSQGWMLANLEKWSNFGWSRGQTHVRLLFVIALSICYDNAGETADL